MLKFNRCTLLGLGFFAAAIANPTMAATLGPCSFDSKALRFAGTAAQTAECLLKRVRAKGGGSDLQPIPDWLSQRVLQPFPFNAEQVGRYLTAQGISSSEISDRIVAGDASGVRYFVIHDTSSPEIVYPSTTFPDDMNTPSWAGNRLQGWPGLAQRVNLLIARDGASRVLRPWGAVRSSPATKLEQTSNVAAAKPLFVHVENIQPRIKPQGSWGWKAPEPGLGPNQEQRLALAYIMASLHAGRWLIPAYHFNIDQGFDDVHDDPQNMDLKSWVDRISSIEREIGKGE